jgi:hypothetical protein
MSHLRVALGLAGMALVAGCAAEQDDATSDASGAITSTDGYREIAPANGAVYQSVAVVKDTAFVGDNSRHIDVVDLVTMRKTGSVAARVVADSLTSDGNKVIACGLRDDSPIDPLGHTPADRSYVLTVIDASTRKVDGEVKLQIESFLASNPRAGHGFVDLPDLSCRFENGAMNVTFAQKELGLEVVSFPMPAIGSSHDWKSIPSAKRTKIGGDQTIKAAVVNDAGVTYAAGGWGLRQQAAGSSRSKTLREEDRETIVDVQIRGEHIYAVDHSSALIVTDVEGKHAERIDIPDWLHAMALTPSHVVVVGRKGLFVAKDRWAR